MTIHFRSGNVATKADTSNGIRAAAVDNKKRVNPLLLFFVAYTGYNLVGLANSPWILSGLYDKSLCWQLFILGCAGILLAYFVPVPHMRKSVTRKSQRSSRQLTALFFILFSVSLLSVIVLSGGIPLLKGEGRFANSALAFNVSQFYGFWVLTRIISDVENGKKPSFIHPFAYIVGALAFGYRTPIIIFSLVILVYLFVFKIEIKKSVKYGTISLLGLLIFSAIFSGFRVSQDHDLLSFFRNVDFQYVSEHKFILPLVPALAMFDYSQNTVSDIGKFLHGHMHGELFVSNYLTFLPGPHWGARNIIGALVGARWVAGRPMSITPTLQGALYVDFGPLGVAVGFLVIAVAIKILWRRSKRWGPIGKFAFSYLLSLSILSIHNGYWDAAFVFFLAFLLIIRFFDLLKRSYPHRSLVQRTLYK